MPKSRPESIRFVCPNCKNFRTFKPTGKENGGIEYKCSVCAVRIRYIEGKITVVRIEGPGNVKRGQVCG